MTDYDDYSDNEAWDKPTTSTDEQWCISPCLCCPECDGCNLDKHETDETWQATYSDVVCLDCGASWCEMDFVDDEGD